MVYMVPVIRHPKGRAMHKAKAAARVLRVSYDYLAISLSSCQQRILLIAGRMSSPIASLILMGMTKLSLHLSQQRPLEIGSALWPKPVKFSPQIAQLFLSLIYITFFYGLC
jgi:hypothetical protein